MIALLSTKHQINNLYNYYQCYNHDFSNLIVICFYENLIIESKNKLNPKKIILIKVSPLNNLTKIKFLINTIRLGFLKEHTLIIGDTMARYKHYLLFLINPKKVIAIDDGIKSVYAFNEKLNFCLPKKYYNRLSFVYTNYDLNFEKIDSFINHYQKKQRSNIDNEKVWFIGQPLIADGKLTSQQLTKYFKTIKSKFKDKEIIYFKHPRELHTYKYSKFKLAEKTDGSFEEYFEKSSYYPGTIITFYSTSIDYCIRSSFSNCGIEFYFFEVLIDQRVKAVCDYLNKNGVKKLN